MKFINKFVDNVLDTTMEVGKFYFAKYRFNNGSFDSVNDVRVVVRLGYDLDGYRDVVMFFGNLNGQLSYADYSYLVNNYTIIGTVSSITVE